MKFRYEGRLEHCMAEAIPAYTHYPQRLFALNAAVPSAATLVGSLTAIEYALRNALKRNTTTDISVMRL